MAGCEQPEAVSAPWSVQLEMSEGCNRLCTFCGLNALRDAPGAPYFFMDEVTARRTAEQLADLCPNARVEFAMHGEPTQNPRFHELVGIFRQHLPNTQFQLTTNGRNWMRDLQGCAEAAFAAGIDIIVLDTYEPERTRLQADARAIRSFKVMDFYEHCVPQDFSPWHNHRRKVQRTLVVMDDIGLRTGEVASRTLMNHAGNATSQPVPPEPLRKTCTIPFREVSVAWNGAVNVCCMDWGHEYTCGNVNERTLRDIWYGEEFTAARRILGSKQRGFSPCDRCNAGSGSRSGLLPKMKHPSLADLDVVSRVHQQPQRNKLPRKLHPELVASCLQKR